MSHPPFVLISILNWNGANKTIRCLESLQSLDYGNFNIIIVDNASGDDSVIRIREALPDIKIIVSESNRGFAGGHELALQEALSQEADLLWILNNDAVIKPDALTQLIDAYSQFGDAVYSSIPLERDEAGKLIVAFHPKYLTPHYVETPLHRRPDLPYAHLFPDEQPKVVSALPGSCLMIPLSVIRQYGFITTDFFMYGEEIDYCFRLRKLGVRSIVVPKSQIVHEGGGSQYNEGIRSVVAYYKARNEIIKAREFDGLVVFALIAIKKTLLGMVNLSKGHIQRGKMIFFGVMDGIRNKRGKRFAPEDYL